jgi:hypothetical protein
MRDNKHILAKADLALSDISGKNGILQPATAQKFIELLILESKILGLANVVPLKAPKQIVNKTRFASRVLRAGQEATPLAESDRTKPSFTFVEHDAKLFKAEIRISDETLEDNIEGPALRNTIMRMLGAAIARDMDEVIIRGDILSADPFLAQFDGILKLAQTNLVDVNEAVLTKAVLRDMMKTMPSEWLRNKGALRFLTSVDAEIDYRDSLADRYTVTGDKALAAMGENTAPVGYSGIPVLDVPMFPENLGPSNNCTNVILTDPKNIQVGIWRDIKIKMDEDISSGEIIIVATLRMDALFEEELAVVKAFDVKVHA